MIQIKSIGGFSKQGKRGNNEDYIIYKKENNPDNRFIILCDGMGGHGHGEIASQTVANAVFEYLESLAKEEYESQDLQDALNTALSALTTVNVYDDKKSMGTTLVVVVINKMNILVGHVGDSRCYLFDENGIKKFRSKDHSKVEEAVAAEILTEEEAFNSIYKNVLTRCVMAGKSNVQIEVDCLQIDNNDRLLLCSDGVNDAMRDKEIEEVLINRDIKSVLEIIDNICAEKSRDNYSVIIADISQDEQNQINVTSPCQTKNDFKSEGYMKCKSCGTENDESASFCKNCGNRLQYTEDTPEEQVINDNTFNSKTFIEKYLKNVTPFLYVLLGSVLTVACIYLSDNTKEKEIKHSIEKKQFVEADHVRRFQNASLKLITNLCSKEDLSDSLLHKDSLKQKYADFCKEYNKTLNSKNK